MSPLPVTIPSGCAIWRDAAQETKKGRVASHHVAKPASVLAQAPATVVRRQSRPSQNAIPIIGPTFSQTFMPATTSGNE